MAGAPFESGPAPGVDVVVPSFNAAGRIAACLRSIEAQTHPNVRAVVVDNGSADGTAELVRGAFPRVALIEMGRNAGFAAAVNRGIGATRGEYVALLNDDAVADPRWVAEMVAALEADPSLGSCASKMLLLGDPSVVNVAGLAFAPRLGACSTALAWGSLDSVELERPRLVLAPSGGAGLYRRRALEAVGPLDDDYFLYYEDFDLGLRLQLAGFDCLYVPTAVVLHDDEAMGRAHPAWVMRLNRRNSRWTALKCLPVAVLAPLGAASALREGAGALRRVLGARLGLASPGEEESVRPPIDVAEAPLPTLLRKRRAVQRTRVVGLPRILEVLARRSRAYPPAHPQAAPHAARGAGPGAAGRRVVALLSHTPNLGGSEQCMLRLATELEREGHRTLAIVPGPGPLARALRSARVRVAVVPAVWWARLPGSPARLTLEALASLAPAVSRLARLLERERVQVLGTISSVVPHGALAARALGIRHVWHVRELYPSSPLVPVLGLAPTLRIIEALSDAIVVPSGRVGALFAGSRKVAVVPEGIDAAFFSAPRQERGHARERLGLPIEAPVVLAAAPLVPAKDAITAVRALATLSRRGVRAELALCGDEWDAGYRDALVREAAALGVGPRVHRLGFRPDFAQLLDAADVLVVPSRSESFGLSIAEAMARGVPVVSTRCGGPEELVEDGASGLLVGVGDADAMAEALARVLGPGDLAQRLAGRGRERAEMFRPERCFELTRRAYLGRG
jgi:GT2 family glycosyltransferase/glycosyltransferase involved in cell wall biosynthesis